MQLLHLTDLHFTLNQPFQKALISALLADIKERVSDGFSADFVVFSGDVVNNPDEPNIYTEFEAQFLKPILALLSLTPKETVFCPGNHDVSQKAIKDWGDEREKLKNALAADQAQLKKLLATAPSQSYVKAISQGFFDLAERCGSPWTNPFANAYSFPNKKISFVSLNSGFGCSLEGSKFDRGKLAILGEHALAAFQEVPEDHQTLTLMHHTLADLCESCSRVLVPMLTEHSSMHFFGHVHQPQPTVVIGQDVCFMVQGGALYETDGYYNGFSQVYTADSAEFVAAHYRTYYRDRMSFDVGTNVAKDGTFYNSPAAQSYWEQMVPAASNDDVCLWLMETVEAVANELDKTITARSLSETFVDPVLTPTDASGSTSSGRISTADILKSSNNTVIACASEYGATSLLSYLTLQFHRECLNLKAASVPSFVDGRRIRASYAAAITSTLRSGLPDSDDRRCKLQPVHDSGRLVILIDDIDPGNNTQIAFLSGVRRQYPKARLIVAVKMPMVDMQRLRPIIGIDKFDFVQVGTLTRGKVRSLVEKWKLPAVYNSDSVVDEIHSRFLALGIPQTAAYVVIYLSVLQEIDGFNPINSSTVIEQFVESALQKYKPVYAFRSSFDYRNQIDFLGAIAERMCKKNQFVIEYEEVYAWTKEYFDEIGLEHDYSKLLLHFVDNKVFAHEGNSLYFRYNIFLTFFIAHRMLRSDEFRRWLLDDHRYTNYISEIDIYCGLSRQDLGILEFLSKEFVSLSAQLAELVKPLAWTDRLEKLTLPAPKKADKNSFTDNINRQLTSNMPAEERDEVMEHGEQPEVKPTSSRPEVLGVLPQWILTLRAYTASLKNLENIPRAKKEEHLGRILRGWSTMVLYGCIVFKEAIEKRELTIGSIKFEIELPPKTDAKALRLIFLTIPVAISDLMRRDLGSQKLALQLRSDNVVSSLSDSFLQTSLYADLKLDEYIGRLKVFKGKAVEASSVVFLEALLLKMSSIFLRLGLRQGEQDAFLHVAGEISAEVKGLIGEERQREIDRYTIDLKRKDQVNRLRENMQ